MHRTLITALSLLTVLALAAPTSAQPTDPATCTASVPDHGCAIHVLTPDDAEVGCGVLTYGYACGFGLVGSGCFQAQWGLHTSGLVVGGHNSCNVGVWVTPTLVSDPPSLRMAAPDCDVSPTWPGGYAGCEFAGHWAGCSVWTGALFLEGTERYACGVTDCNVPTAADVGDAVRVQAAGCTVLVSQEEPAYLLRCTTSTPTPRADCLL